MASSKPLLPYQQGHLDGLCGIYAIVNAIRLAVRGSPGTGSLGDTEWGELFHVLLSGADRTVGAVIMTAAGIEPKPLLKLLKLAARHMADEHELAIAVSRPWKLAKPAQPQDAFAELASIAMQPGSALIVCLSGYHDHWTVVRKVSRTTLELLDSDGLTRVKLANCRLSRDRRSTGGRQHILRARAVFRIGCRRTDR